MTKHADRRENQLREFPAGEIADTLEQAADVRKTLGMCRDRLMADADGRPCDEHEAARASTQGCIRIAAIKMKPDSRHDARDLNWLAATEFSQFIGHGILYYDTPERTVEQASADLNQCAKLLRMRGAAAS